MKKILHEMNKLREDVKIYTRAFNVRKQGQGHRF